MVGEKAAVVLLVTICALAACRYPRPEVAAEAPLRPAGAQAAEGREAGAADRQSAPDPGRAVVSPSDGVSRTGAGRDTGAAQTASEQREVLRPAVPDLPPGPAGDLARYGRAIIEDTPRALGRASRDGGWTAGRLSCRNCHLDAGARETAFPWLGRAAAYPRYDARAGRVVGLEEKVNECLVRCLNAAPLPPASRQMQAILAYIGFLPAAAEESRPLPPFPDHRADLASGEETFSRQCQRCHGENGEGSSAAPPLWGPDSYSTGAPMHRLLPAALFIYTQMPPGQAGLTAEQAIDVAGFVNSFARPETADLHLDYPALTEKPVDSPYPPYPDRFPADQHKYGPFHDILKEWESSSRSDHDLK